MNMSTWSIRHPVTPIAIFIMLVLMGLFSFRNLPVTAMPNIDLPFISVTVSQAGAAPSELIRQVVQPIEDSIAGITGVRHITSTASDGAAVINVEFELETDPDRAVNDVKDAVANVRSDLPDSILEPIVKRIDVASMAILTYAVSNPAMSIQELSRFVDDVIGRELSSVPGVANVARIGGADRQINIDLDPDRVHALGLTAAEVSQHLRQDNIDLGGGRGDLSGTEYSIRTLNSAGTVEALAATAIPIAGGKTVRLDQLGTVQDSAGEDRSFALLNGRPVVAFGIFRAKGKSDLSAGDDAKARLAELQQRYPDITIALVDDATTRALDSYHGTMKTLYEGAALAVAVVFLFLRNWRATAIAAVALPLSIIPTFFVMSWLGFTLNGISLLAITLVTGILVDDAIVEIENIDRHIHKGLPAFEASEAAASEIGLTVIAISFSIVAVFAPVGLMAGIAGQYFKQFGLTVAVSVLFSLLVARTVTPMMGAYLMRDGAHSGETGDGPIMRRFMAIVGWTMRHRGATLMIGLLVFAISIFSATLLPTEFLPASDEGRSQIKADLPPGSTVQEVAEATRILSQRIMAVEEVRSVFVIGGDGEVNETRFLINYGHKKERKRSSFQIEDQLRQDLALFPDLRINFQNQAGQNDFSITVLGSSQESVASAANSLITAMKTLPTLEGVTSSSNLLRPELQIRPHPELAAQMGVSTVALATTLRIATIGDIEANLAKFSAADQQVPIMVRLNQAMRQDLSKLGDVRLPGSFGPVPLNVVADLKYGAGATQISRYDRRYSTTVSANLVGDALLGPVNTQVLQVQAGLELPADVTIRPAADAEIMGEVFEAFSSAMLMGVVMVYVVLVLLFHNFVTPISIVLSLPLAIGGAIIALAVTGNSISMMVVIGFLMLMGIVTKNAIMLVEFALTSIEAGVPKSEAILDAVHKRARPIVMTTIAMTAGMVPSAIGTGQGSEYNTPMAIAVIGGLLLSTLLSMLFVPSLFSLIHGGQERLGGWLTRMIGINRPQKD